MDIREYFVLAVWIAIDKPKNCLPRPQTTQTCYAHTFSGVLFKNKDLKTWAKKLALRLCL